MVGKLIDLTNKKAPLWGLFPLEQTMSRANYIDTSSKKTSFPNRDNESSVFKFGLETEYIISSLESLECLSYLDITFEEIEKIIDNVVFDDLPGDFSVLEIEAPMKKASPVIIEGYGLVDEDFKVFDMLPKGIEIRTSVCSSIDECLYVQKTLFNRVKKELNKNGLDLIALSHHPTLKNFHGPQNKRRYDWWQWAMQVMTTYGPDINISVPTHLLKDFDLEAFDEKVNYYSPALTALSCASPLFDGQIWEGVSMRTHKRSIVAPAIEYHSDEDNRLEFKFFDMSPNLYDYEAYFLIALSLVLNKDLKGKADKATRIYELGQVAKHGLQTPNVMTKLYDFFENTEATLKKHGFCTDQLARVYQRMRTKMTLADEYKGIYRKGQKYLYHILSKLDETQLKQPLYFSQNL